MLLFSQAFTFWRCSDMGLVQIMLSLQNHLSKGSHTLTIRALDNHIIVDQLRLETFLPDSFDVVTEVIKDVPTLYATACR